MLAPSNAVRLTVILVLNFITYLHLFAFDSCGWHLAQDLPVYICTGPSTTVDLVASAVSWVIEPHVLQLAAGALTLLICHLAVYSIRRPWYFWPFIGLALVAVSPSVPTWGSSTEIQAEGLWHYAVAATAIGAVDSGEHAGWNWARGRFIRASVSLVAVLVVVGIVVAWPNVTWPFPIRTSHSLALSTALIDPLAWLLISVFGCASALTALTYAHHDEIRGVGAIVHNRHLGPLRWMLEELEAVEEFGQSDGAEALAEFATQMRRFVATVDLDQSLLTDGHVRRDLSLVDAIAVEALAAAAGSPFDVFFHTDHQGGSRWVRGAVREALQACFGAALANALAVANNEVTVITHTDKHYVGVTVIDDGPGWDGTSGDSGRSFAHMVPTRLADVGGWWSAAPHPDGGTQVQLVAARNGEGPIGRSRRRLRRHRRRAAFTRARVGRG